MNIRNIIFASFIICLNTSPAGAQVEELQSIDALEFLWINHMGGPLDDFGYDIAVDKSGNSIVTGFFQGTVPFGSTVLTSYGKRDGFIAKIDQDGNFVWAVQLGGTGNDIAYSVDLDNSDNIIVTGSFRLTSTFGTETKVSSGEEDIFVAKYDADGNLIWVNTAGGSSVDRAQDASIDEQGNIIVTGFMSGEAAFDQQAITSYGGFDVFIVKYNSSGDMLWVKHAGSDMDDYTYSVATDDQNNIILAGDYNGLAAFDGIEILSLGETDIFLAKYDADGDLQWIKDMGGEFEDTATAVAVDDENNILVGGQFNGRFIDFGVELYSEGMGDIFIEKYSHDGNVIWARQAGGPGDDQVLEMICDPSGNIYMTGYFEEGVDFDTVPLQSAGIYDIFISKYDPSGHASWATRFGGIGWDKGWGIDLDHSGNCYFIGYFNRTVSLNSTILTSNGIADIIVLKSIETQSADQSGPDIVPSVISGAVKGQSLSVAAAITDAGGVKSATLFYREGGMSAYASVPMTDQGNGTYTAAVPGAAVTECGLEYYIHAEDNPGNTSTSPAGTGASSPYVVRVSYADFSCPDQTPAQSYRMISVPGDLNDKTIGGVLDELSSYDIKQWRLYSVSDTAYVEYDGDSGWGFFTAGNGYWLITRRAEQWSTGSGMSVSTAQNAVLTLDPGWNIIGNPFAFDVSWSAVVKSQNVEDPWGYSGTGNESEGYALSDVLRSWSGYLVKNTGAAAEQIEIPAVEYIGTLEKTTVPVSRELEPGEWVVGVRAECGRRADGVNFLGCLNGAHDKWDENDFSEPLPIGDYVSVFFPHEEWKDRPGMYAADFRSHRTDDHTWEMRVKTNIARHPVHLSFTDVEHVPEGVRIVLMDETAGISQDLTVESVYAYLSGTGESERSFRIMAGGDEVMDDVGSTVPEEITLLQNYPNPFNAMTMVAYALTQASEVTIEVYDVQGKRVDVLENGAMGWAGYHTVIWEGKASDGHPAPSGIYILHLKCGNRSQWKKMLLAR